jgi:hypothetical protein
VKLVPSKVEFEETGTPEEFVAVATGRRGGTLQGYEDSL